MFSALKWIVKTVVFAALILVLGNLIQWRGKTISDQIKSGLSSAQPTGLADRVKNWAGEVMRDTQNGDRRKLQSTALQPAAAMKNSPAEIPNSERQKLRALIQELNQAYGQD